MKTIKNIGILLASAVIFSVSTINTFAESEPYNTGNPVLDKVFTKYENSLKSKGDQVRLKLFSQEKNKINSRKISDNFKDQLLQEQILSSSGINLGSDIAKSIKNTASQKNALKGLVNSIKKDDIGMYRLFIKTTLSQVELTDTFAFFDNVTLKLVSNQDDSKSIYELSFSNKGRLAKFLSSKLNNGEIPLSLFDGVETVKPTFVQNLVSTGSYLSGELLNNLWGMKSLKATDYQYGLSKTAKIKIGIIDTGINGTHPDLVNNIGVGYNFISRSTNANDDNGHGSHVSGIAGGGVNAKGIFGVDSNVTLIPLKVLDASGYGSSYTIVDAINYAANNGIRVLNLSLGGTGNPASDIICNAITSAKSKGTITVVAAGNSNTDVSTVIPAGCSDSITVAAVDSNMTKASFSNYGTKVDVAAPGVNIYSSYLNSSYVTMNGTSMATPFITGLTAAILSYNPGLSTDQIKQILKDPNNLLPVTSTVNIGKFADMSKIMTGLGIKNDSLLDNPPATGTGTTSSGTTNTGTTTPPTTNTGTTSSGVISPTPTPTPTPIITNQPPVLNLSFKAINTRTNRITINTSDNDGTIARVDIYINGVYKFYATPNAKSFLAYLDVKKGISYAIKVVSKDNKGATTEKSITVK